MFDKFWKELKNPSGSFSVASKVLPLMFILGLSPYALEGTRGSQIFVCRKIGFLIPLIYIFIFVGSNISTYLSDDLFGKLFLDTAISRFSGTMFTVVNTVNTPVVFLNAFIQRDMFVEFFRRVTELEGQFKRLGYKLYSSNDSGRFQRNSLLALVVFNLAFFSYCIWLFLSRDLYPSIGAYISFFMPTLYVQFNVICFLCICSRVRGMIITGNMVSELNYKSDVM